MKRRSFFKTAAAAALGGAMGTAHGENQRMRIDSQRLDHRNQNRSTVAACQGMVCTSQPLASLAGLDVLRAGGSAVDAAIAANAMLSLVEAVNCGPGGDLFAIVWDEKNKKLHGLNASGRSPYDWNLKDALGLGLKSINPYSPLSWSVPGCVSGWSALHKKFGQLAWKEIFAPTLRYAREGYALSPLIATSFGFNPEKHGTLIETYWKGGREPAFGDVCTNTQLADFYELLLRDGVDSFYQGEIGERIAAFSKANGGRFSLRDFKDHTADWIDPVSTSYRGYDVWELPPNGQGIAALQILNMLERFDIAALPPNSAEQLHLFLEAKKLAYEDRAVYYADMEKADVPVEWLISKDYGRERAKAIDPKRAAQSVKPGQQLDKSDTVYLTVADKDGNMVSLIQSTYHGWGSHIVPDKLGFALQNRGELFALDENHRNRLEAHKRPFHTIIPAFVTQNGAPAFSFGVMGGDFQPQGHAQVLMNWIDHGMSPQQAGDQPRVEHGGSSTPTGRVMRGGGSVRCERFIPDDVRSALEDLGHEVRKGNGAFGGYQAIARLDEPLRYFGGTDARKDGAAMGY
jgi:gamma-glutamyltranspeptidase / glutathione hydrolase